MLRIWSERTGSYLIRNDKSTEFGMNVRYRLCHFTGILLIYTVVHQGDNMDLGAEVKAGECRLGGAVLYHVRCDGVSCLSVIGACDALEVRGLVDLWAATAPLAMRDSQCSGVVLNFSRLRLSSSPEGEDFLGKRVPVAGLVCSADGAAALRAHAIAQVHAGLLRGVFVSSDLATQWVRERALALSLHRRSQAASTEKPA